MEARAFCPGHITTFFVPRGGAGDPPIKRGSLGSGFTIETGVGASGNATGGSWSRAASGAKLPFELKVFDNGARVSRPTTTEATLRELVRRAGALTQFPAVFALQNSYSLPLGAGFGVSGACALTAALLANETMGLGLSRADCVAAAHCGEVEALSGLGDVGPQSLGGFEIRLREGPPPLGEILRPRTRPEPLLLVSFGPRPTRAFLSSPSRRSRIAAFGSKCLDELMQAPSLDRSVRLGREFAEALNLVSPAAQGLLSRLDGHAPASIAMLGDSVFAVGRRAVERLPGLGTLGPFIEKTRIARRGARLV